jgi:hypothetical protein
MRTPSLWTAALAHGWKISAAELPTFNFAYAASNPPGQALRLSRVEAVRQFAQFGYASGWPRKPADPPRRDQPSDLPRAGVDARTTLNLSSLIRWWVSNIHTASDFRNFNL